MKISIQIPNNQKKALEAKLKEMANKQPKILMNELYAAGLEIETMAKKNTTPNVDTGRLRSSIVTQRDDKAVYVSTNVEYAASLEFGTSTSRAFPYFIPAYRRGVQKLLKRLKHMVK